MLVGNISDPAAEALVALWDNPTDHTSIAVDADLAFLVSFTVLVEAPDCPRLELPTMYMIKGNA